MNLLLTDEEIQVVIQSALAGEDKELGDYVWMVTDEDRAVAKAQFKKVVEWLGEWQDYHYETAKDYAETGNQNTDGYRKAGLNGQAFGIVLQALLEETE